MTSKLLLIGSSMALAALTAGAASVHESSVERYTGETEWRDAAEALGYEIDVQSGKLVAYWVDPNMGVSVPMGVFHRAPVTGWLNTTGTVSEGKILYRSTQGVYDAIPRQAVPADVKGACIRALDLMGQGLGETRAIELASQEKRVAQATIEATLRAAGLQAENPYAKVAEGVASVNKGDRLTIHFAPDAFSKMTDQQVQDVDETLAGTQGRPLSYYDGTDNDSRGIKSIYQVVDPKGVAKVLGQLVRTHGKFINLIVTDDQGVDDRTIYSARRGLVESLSYDDIRRAVSTSGSSAPKVKAALRALDSIERGEDADKAIKLASKQLSVHWGSVKHLLKNSGLDLYFAGPGKVESGSPYEAVAMKIMRSKVATDKRDAAVEALAAMDRGYDEDEAIKHAAKLAGHKPDHLKQFLMMHGFEPVNS